MEYGDDGGGDVETGPWRPRRQQQQQPQRTSSSSRLATAARAALSKAGDAACCLLTPCKMVATIVVVLLIVLIGLAIAIVVALNQTDEGASMLATLKARLLASGQDHLLAVLDTLDDSQLGAVLSRMPFSTTADVSVFAVLPASKATMQGWLETRATSLRYSVTVVGLTASQIGALVVAQRAANQTVTLYELARAPFGSAASAETATVTISGALTCPSPWGHCQRLLSSRLAGDRTAVVLLSRPPAVTVGGLPPLEDVLLEAHAGATAA